MPANSPPDSFARLYSRHDMLRGRSLATIIWSMLASLGLVAALFVLFLVADLLETGGHLVLDSHGETLSAADHRAAVEQQQEDLQEFIGSEAFTRFAPQSFIAADGYRVEYQNAGLLPTVWRGRDRWWGGMLADAYGSISMLQQNRSALVLLVLCGVFVGVVRSVLMSFAARNRMEAALDVATRLRSMIHRQRLRLGPGDLRESETNTVEQLFKQDVDTVTEGVSQWLGRVGRYPFLLAMLLLLALLIDWRVTLQCLIPVALGWYVLQPLQLRAQQNRRQAVSRSDEELRLLSESLRKTRLIRGYAMEDFESEQFQRNLERYRQGQSRIESSDRSAHWVARLVVLVVASVVLVLVGLKILQPDDVAHGLTFSGALVLMTVFAWMYRPLEELFQAQRDRREASVVADRVYRYLDRIPDVGQAVGAKFLQPLSKRLEFESVSYHLPNVGRILDNLDLKIPAGSSVAVVSLDPLQPKALAYLLPRFIEPQKGIIRFDGQDIAWVTLESLRNETVFVGGADPFLTGSVRENIACGRSEYSLQDVTAAAKQVHASKFVLDLPQGYETIIGEHGEQLDAGQAFRLGLARAVLRNPALMIIEEPLAALDEDTKALLDDAYNRIVRNRTVIFLPSRLSTIKRCDRIVVLHQGRVEAVGPHSELVRSSQLYRHWEYLRFNAISRELVAR